jgi:hypothetical protein
MCPRYEGKPTTTATRNGPQPPPTSGKPLPRPRPSWNAAGSPSRPPDLIGPSPEVNRRPWPDGGSNSRPTSPQQSAPLNVSAKPPSPQATYGRPGPYMSRRPVPTLARSLRARPPGSTNCSARPLTQPDAWLLIMLTEEPEQSTPPVSSGKLMLNQSPPGSPRSRTRQRSRCDFDSTGVAGNHSVSFPGRDLVGPPGRQPARLRSHA